MKRRDSGYESGDSGGSSGGKYRREKFQKKKSSDRSSIKSILRKPADHRRSPSPSRSRSSPSRFSSSNHPQRQGQRKNGAYDVSDGSDFDEVNMMQEIIVDDLNGGRIDQAFQAAVARRSRMVCIDSGANIFVLTFLAELARNIRDVANRFIRTATAGGQLRVEALFNCGHVLDIRHCPDASANLMPTNVLVALHCSVTFNMVFGIPRCQILANEGSHGGDPDILFCIDCVRDNDLW